MKKTRLLCLIFVIAMLFTTSLGVISVLAAEAGNSIIPESDIPLRLWYDEEAPKINENLEKATTDGKNEDIGWARWSLPVGNGYFGASVFGRTETERIQITEKTLMNPTSIKVDDVWHTIGGLNSFSETYIDFGHTNSDVTDYERYLDIKTAISGVEYTYGGVKYTREYFTSYPDKALVIRLDADTSGALSFTLRPTIPYERPFAVKAGDGVGKTGTVTSKVEGGIGKIELAGEMEYYGIDFLAIYNVYTDGGTVSASTVSNTYKIPDGTSVTDTDGVITVSGAKSAYIVVTLGTDYELTEDVFTSPDTAKPTKNTDLTYTKEKIGAYMSSIENKLANKNFEEGYNALKTAHVKDHSDLFGSVSVNFGYTNEELATTTDKLLDDYKAGNFSSYLEALIFQYGRYLLIASSREGALPANLQGAWNTYNTPAWACAYTHNINVQMNYWAAFSTGLAETFQSYVDYNAAYLKAAQAEADKIINQYNPDASGDDGGNGWVIGNHIYPYRYTSDRSAGNLGLTTQLFWEYYEYTKDPEVLEDIYTVLIEAARYITKCVEKDENGNYLVAYCDSPEVHVNGVWYYTSGTTYAQTFAYLNNYHALLAAKDLGIDFNDTTHKDYAIIQTILEQIDKYDPINVGLSGQLKEFREETYYSSIGDDPTHRHVSQLMCLYPGNIVNSTTPAWLDAAEVTLNNRGLGSMGWSRAHRTALYARVKDGEGAYSMLTYILRDRTGYNLWNSGPPFQIDGSFGLTAGVAEMLLQSHEGYIEPLAALPEAWSTGSYTGLVARNGFEVSAAWENGLAKTFNIKSNLGGTASVYYPAIANAYVVDSEGNAVSVTKGGADLISFETEAEKTYVIYGFVAKNIPASPSNLACTEENGTLNFTWDTVSGAASYNVYVAVENADDYTLIGNTNTNSFTYTPDESVKGLRTTYAVTAVGEGESKRALVYTVETVVTEYGEIPSSSVGGDATFAIFAKKKGATTYKFIETGTALVADGLDKARQYLKAGSGTYQGGEIVVYLLKDYTSKGTASGAGWNAAFQMDGTLTVDLGGHKLTSTAPRFIGVEARTSESGLGYNKETNIVIKNGEFCTAKPIVELFGASGVFTGTKVCNVTCSDVTFTPNGTPSSFTMFEARGSYSATQKATLGLTFNNCEFNFSSLTTLNIVKDSTAAGAVSTSVEYSGGNIRLSSIDGLGVLLGTAEDTSIFTKPSNASRTEFTFKYTSTAPTVTFNTDDGVKHLASATIDNATAESSRTTTYRLSGFKTPYGYVPENLTDKSFALFYNDLHIGSYGVYLNAEKKVQELLYPNAKGIYLGETLTLYMLKDYNHADEPYNNFSQIDGTLVLDLGGKTLSMKENSLFHLVGKAVNNTVLKTTAVVVKNGAILLGASPLAKIESKGTSGNFGYNGTKTFDFIFDGVTFDKLASATAYAPLFAVGQIDETQSKNIMLKAVFNGCSLTSGEGPIFDLSVSNYVDSQITFNGGSITASTLTETSILKGSDGDDVFAFGKLDGEYTTLTLPKAHPAPTLSFNGGELTFVKASVGESSTTYKLQDKTIAELGFVPKTSVTLDGNFTLNIYVPKAGLVSFTLDGVEYTDLSALEDNLVILSDKEYYKLTVRRLAMRSADEVDLVAKISGGDNTAVGTFTFSLLTYCADIIESSEFDRTAKTLAKDILAYVKSAYLYFDSENKDAVSSAVDTIIGNHVSAFEKLSGATLTGNELHAAQLILRDSPAIRFYLDGSKAKEDYTFFIGTEALTPSAFGTARLGAETFAYVEFTLSAYQLVSDITYTVGTSSGSYHINSYYDFVTTDSEHKDNAALRDIVEKLYCYAVSAKSYKDNTASPCTHSYTATVKKEASAMEAGLIEYKCSHCNNVYRERIPTTLKILAVGNSFSVDAMQHLYLVAKDAGIENVVLGTLYKGGCSLDMHYEYMSGDLANYETFYVADSTTGALVAKSKNVTAKYAITYENWDYIVIQQVSNYSGMADKCGKLQDVIDYINANKTSDAELLWHMTWAYQQDTTNSGFNNYGKDQLTMYNAIVSLATGLISDNSDISAIIPSGTAIQNLRTSPLGDTLTRDGYHMSYGIGRYTAALTWLAFITGCDISDITATPLEYPEVEENLEYIKAAVKAAIENPYTVTDLDSAD